jgi:hypothetical protein
MNVTALRPRDDLRRDSNSARQDCNAKPEQELPNIALFSIADPSSRVVGTNRL